MDEPIRASSDDSLQVFGRVFRILFVTQEEHNIIQINLSQHPDHSTILRKRRSNNWKLERPVAAHMMRIGKCQTVSQGVLSSMYKIFASVSTNFEPHLTSLDSMSESECVRSG